ncbi:MAG TPA: hypothetical protein VMT85_07815 [Thermoanaerobaculia bacterium]|nr:hypothetical protein [Thermoanaerobaculia bacterium]
MSKTITALYNSTEAAAEAVDRLLAEGVGKDDISVLMSESLHGRDIKLEEHTKAPEGATAGAVTGGALGGIAAGLVAVGVIAAPGIGLLAAGPLVAVLAGAGAGGAAGGLTGALIGLGLPEHEAKTVSERLDEDHILVAVHTHDDRRDLVRELLNQEGTHVRG